MPLTLYTYFRSSAAYRVRIALNLKGLKYTSIFVNLRESEQTQSPYLTINPQGLVPTLRDGDLTLSQSMAILSYLEETYPTPPLLPKKASERAKINSICLAMACDIHPLNNLRVLTYLTKSLEVTQEQKNQWYHHWLHEGLRPLEQQLAQTAGLFCFGDEPTLADVCLIPQIYNAIRFNCDLSKYPTLYKIYDHSLTFPAFIVASPENQADFIK